MTVSKELLQDNNIISISLKFIKKESLSQNAPEPIAQIACVLNRYEKGVLHFNLFGNISEISFNEVKLHICIKEADICFYSETAILKVEEKGMDWLTATVKNEPPKTIQKLLIQLSSLEDQEEKFGRRKEPRIKINKDNYTKFGLLSMEQKIFSRSTNSIQPCALIDFSVHGICIITPFENPVFKNQENFYIQISFANPEQTVILQCHKVHSKLNNTENRTFITLSCQLLEPIHYIWKERVLRMLENEDINNFIG